MFEKEAEKSTEEIRSEPWFDEGEYYSEGYSDGYDRGFQNGAEFGYDKANEWHNIKENPNDLPNDGELVVADNGLTIDCVKFRKNEFSNSWIHDKFELYNVMYWKKLVLLKDRKINEM